MTSNIYWETISAEMRDILRHFGRSKIAEKFYLAGGTALALQMGHRHSIDLDFFSPSEDIPGIRPQLDSALEGILADSAWGNLVYLVKNVRVGFYGYGFALVAPPAKAENILIASIEDIALMKLDALLSRASRKDFYDLFFIAQIISLTTIFQKAPQKYPSVRDFEAQTVKRLVYFENAEQESDPLLLKPVAWEDVKQFFIEEARKIQKGWLA
jgi:predicted nucleotidyltransferase component of viral defense system